MYTIKYTHLSRIVIIHQTTAIEGKIKHSKNSFIYEKRPFTNMAVVLKVLRDCALGHGYIAKQRQI